MNENERMHVARTALAWGEQLVDHSFAKPLQGHGISLVCGAQLAAHVSRTHNRAGELSGHYEVQLVKDFFGKETATIEFNGWREALAFAIGSIVIKGLEYRLRTINVDNI